MAAGKTREVESSLCRFLKVHSLEENIGAVDEIVLSYVISILEELGDGENGEESLDVDQFVEVMDAYVPGFGAIPSVEVYEWMFELAGSLAQPQEDGTKTAPDEEPTVLKLDCSVAVATEGAGVASDLNSAGGSERSTSESSDEVDEQLQMLIDMFPETLKVEIEHCYSVAEGNLEKAAQIVLYREESGTAIKSPAEAKEKRKSPAYKPADAKKTKELLMARYAYIDEEDDKKTHKPMTPKSEPKKLVRYLDSKVVNTRGNRFTEMKKDDSEEMKKTYINLKPAKQYRFH